MNWITANESLQRTLLVRELSPKISFVRMDSLDCMVKVLYCAINILNVYRR